MIREALETLKGIGSVEVDTEMPYDDEDIEEIKRELHEGWFLDRDLLKVFDKIYSAFTAIFGVCEKTKLLKSYIPKDSQLNDRVLGVFTRPNWLTRDDLKSIKTLRYWAGNIRYNRPIAIEKALRKAHPEVEKKVESEAARKKREFDEARRQGEAGFLSRAQVADRARRRNIIEQEPETVEGSVLKVPPLPAGEDYLKALTRDGECVLVKVRNIHKRLGRRKDIKELARLLDPNTSMRDGPKLPYQAPAVPQTPKGVFQTGYV